MEKLSPEILANYIDTLQIYAKEHKLSDDLFKTIQSLPSSTHLLKKMNSIECLVVQEAVYWAWKRLTGGDLIEELNVSNEAQEIRGHYWWFRNGVVFHGVNHITIIKQNMQMICSLLDVNPMVILQLLSGDNNALMGVIIRNGGVRVYVDENKHGYFGMSAKAYGEWGKGKVQKIDLPKKTIKLIDETITYEGWGCGITVKL